MVRLNLFPTIYLFNKQISLYHIEPDFRGVLIKNPYCLTHFQTIVSDDIVRLIHMFLFYSKHKIREAFFTAAIFYITMSLFFPPSLTYLSFTKQEKRKGSCCKFFLFTLFCSLCCSLLTVFQPSFSKYFLENIFGKLNHKQSKLSQYRFAYIL